MAVTDAEQLQDRAARELAMLRAVRSFGDAHDRMSSGMKHGMRMNPTDLATLRLLIMRAERGQAVSPNEIAKHLRISTASTTKLLDRLSKTGHLRRVPHPSDRRAQVIELTDLSKAEFFRLFGPKLMAMRAAFAQFSDDELDAAARVIDAMGGALDPDGQ